MKRVLLSASAALLIGFATISSPAIAAEGGGGGGGGMSHGGGGGGGGGAAFSRGGGGGGPGGSVMSHAAPSGSGAGNFSARGNAGTFVGGNNSISRGGDARMGRMDHDRGGDHDGRFRGPNFAFGFYPGYDYNSYDYDYDPGCYQPRQVHTRYGWRWRQVWVCD